MTHVLRVQTRLISIIGSSRSRLFSTSNRMASQPASDSLRVHETSQSSFTSNAALYDTARPSYIPSAIDALTKMLELKQGSKVLDLVSSNHCPDSAMGCLLGRSIDHYRRVEQASSHGSYTTRVMTFRLQNPVLV